MKKILIVLAFFSLVGKAQTAKGVKIGYIDMEYILEKVPDYAEAINQLEQKALKWKQEVETKQNAIKVLRDNLKAERVLLTKELIEEREEEINYLEKDVLDYQEKRFGPKGDLIIQKGVLVKPIQDQIFTIVQDVAEQRKYDFIFDRASDLTMLFADKKHNISDYVVKKLTSVQKREEMSEKQLKILEAKEALQDLISDNPEASERQKKIDEKKAAREKLLEERQKAKEEKMAEAAAKKEKEKEEREAKKNGTVIEKNNSEPDNSTKSNTEADENVAKTTDAANEKKEANADARKKAIEEKNKKAEERKKALEEKKQKLIADKEAAKKAKEEKAKEQKTESQKKE